MNKHAVGIVIQNRWDLTYKTLMSLYYSDQAQDSYDLYVIDNGSSEENVQKLKEFLNSNLLLTKNVILVKELSISQAWNLFLSLTKDYQFRTKVDNDLVLYNTPTVQIDPPLTDNKEFRRSKRDLPTGSVNPGAIPNASIVKGANAKSKNRPSAKIHSRFLVHMEEYYHSHDPHPEIVCLLPVTPGDTFQAAMKAAIRKASIGVPYLVGACMMISKDCFQKIGYFDERVHRRIDVEYTQRAVRNGFRLGYHDSFWVLHMGAGQNTDSKEVRQRNYQIATRIQEEESIEQFADSKWNLMIDKIQKKLRKNKILNIS